MGTSMGPREKDLFWRLNEYADNMIREGQYIKKVIKEIKRERE